MGLLATCECMKVSIVPCVLRSVNWAGLMRACEDSRVGFSKASPHEPHASVENRETGNIGGMLRRPHQLSFASSKCQRPKSCRMIGGLRALILCMIRPVTSTSSFAVSVYVGSLE